LYYKAMCRFIQYIVLYASFCAPYKEVRNQRVLKALMIQRGKETKKQIAENTHSQTNNYE